MIDDYQVIMSQGKELVNFYRQNPCVAAYDLLNVDFAPIQRVVFNDMWFKNYTIGVCARGFGKTFVLGVIACLSSLLYPSYRVGLISPTFRQSLVISDIYDTFWTDNGLITTTDDFYNSIQPGFTKVQSLNSQNTIVSKWKNDDRSCRYIKTTKGFELSGTADHAVKVLDLVTSELYFKDLQDITNDDYIVIKTGFNYFGDDNKLPIFNHKLHWASKDCKIPIELVSDLSYLFGLIVGDSCVSFKEKVGSYGVDFVNADSDLLNYFKDFMLDYFGMSVYEYKRKNGAFHLGRSNKKLYEFLLKCGFTKTTALDKKIPDVVKKASRYNIISFLQGLMDADGCVYVQTLWNRYKGCEVHLSTSSLQLAKEVQSILLNIGIISNIGISKKAGKRCLLSRKKESNCADTYKVRITGQHNIIKYRDEIGFRSKRKRDKLNEYIDNHFNRKESTARCLGLPKNIVDKNRSKYLEFMDRGLYFVKVKESKYFFAPTIDAEVENEHCYWSSGFISHNSKMIFSEVEKLCNKSSILREAIEKGPNRGSDTCYIKFKSVGGANGSFIEALPLGSDGAKIRGSRFYLLCIDELAQVPDKIIDLVLRPMGAVVLEPMENVRRIERQRMMIESGLASEDDFEGSLVNKIIMTSSGYYKFNHMWRRMKDYWQQMEMYGEKSMYSVWQVPYQELPDGFLDRNNIDEAKRIMSYAEFSMEYEAAMISDSEGFFKASLLEECTIGSDFTIELRGDPSSKYVIGFDPNQGGDASCGVIVIKIGAVNKIVNALELKGRTTQDLTVATQELCNAYNVVRIFMDKGGGGKAVMDLLDEGYNGCEPIIDRTDDDKKQKKGLHILEMITFNPAWISDANFSTKALLEGKMLKFPEPPLSTIDMEAKAYEKILTLKSQMLNIIVTQTSSGLLHFDTPKKGQKKDLYSAMILAGYGVRILQKELEDDGEPVLYNSSGMVRMRRPGATWNQLSKEGPVALKQNVSMAVLQRKIK